MIHLGGSKFETPDSNGKLGEIQTGLIRWYTELSTGNALTSLNGSASKAFSWGVVAPNRFVEIVNFNVIALFIDSGVATYNVSSLVFQSWSFPRFSNTNIAYINSNNKPLNLLLEIDSSNNINTTVSINGGDVWRATGITPGVGDSVNFYLSVAYKA